MPTRELSARSKATRDSLISHAIAEINQVGIDGLSVSTLIARAKISRPTFYSYFGDVAGLLAETWLALGEEWIERLARPGEFVLPHENDNVYALSEIVITAHRNEEVREVVEATFSKIFGPDDVSTGVAAVRLWRIANRLGVLGTTRLWGRVNNALFLDSFLDVVDPLRVKPSTKSYDELPEIELESSDIIDSRMAVGVIGVVGQDGVKGLSVLRLGRIMRVTSGYLNPRVDNLSELVALTYTLVQDSAARQNVTLWNLWKLNPRGFARFIVGSLGGSRQQWRMFRNEVLVAASHNRELAQRILPSMESLVTIVGKRVAGFGFPTDATSRISILVHTMLFGFSALSTVGVNIPGISHEALIDGLLKELARRNFSVEPRVPRRPGAR